MPGNGEDFHVSDFEKVNTMDTFDSSFDSLRTEIHRRSIQDFIDAVMDSSSKLIAEWRELADPSLCLDYIVKYQEDTVNFVKTMRPECSCGECLPSWEQMPHHIRWLKNLARDRTKQDEQHTKNLLDGFPYSDALE